MHYQFLKFLDAFWLMSFANINNDVGNIQWLLFCYTFWANKFFLKTFQKVFEFYHTPYKVGSATHLSIFIIYFEINGIDYICNICTPQIDGTH